MNDQYLLTYSLDGTYIAEIVPASEVARHIATSGFTYEQDFRVYEFISGRPSRLFPNYTSDLTQLELRNSGYEPVITIDIEY